MALNHVDDVKHWRDRAAEMFILSTTMKDIEAGHHGPLGQRLREACGSSRATQRSNTKPAKQVGWTANEAEATA